MAIRKEFITALMLALMLLVVVEAAADEPVNAWLCVTEYEATVGYDEVELGSELSSISSPFDLELLIDHRGMRVFGEEYLQLTQCTFNEDGRPLWCEDNLFDGVSGALYIDKNNVFIWYAFIRPLEDETSEDFHVLIGHCSELFQESD